MRRLDAYRKGEQGDLGERYQYVSGLPVEILFFRRGRHSRGRGGERDDRSDVFGSILHKVMEELYKPFKGKMVTVDLLKAIRKDTALHRSYRPGFRQRVFQDRGGSLPYRTKLPDRRDDPQIRGENLGA